MPITAIIPRYQGIAACHMMQDLVSEREERGGKDRKLLAAYGVWFQLRGSLVYSDGKRLGENGSRLAPRTAVLGVQSKFWCQLSSPVRVLERTTITCMFTSRPDYY